MPNIEKYCKKCGLEIPHEGMTMFHGKKVCTCYPCSTIKEESKTSDKGYLPESKTNI